MASLGYNYVVISFLCGVTILFCIISNIEVVAGATQKALFVFGDSLYDAGNNQYYTPTLYISANHYPYGTTYFSTATGRCSDGLIVPDFIAKYAKLPLIPPSLDYTANGTYGYNFASAGAGVLYHDDAMNFGDQVSLFKNLTATMELQIGEEEYKIVLQKSVYLFSIGGNDYKTFCIGHKNVSQQEMQDYVDLVIQGITMGIKKIYMIGGRKLAFQDVGPLGCLPTLKYDLGTKFGCNEELNYIIKLHNIALRRTLQNLSETEGFENIKYGVFDYYHQLYNRLKNATNYGFVDGQSACCGYGETHNAINCGTSPYFLCSNPSAFVLFDGAHTSQAANSQLAKLLWNGDPTIISPYNVKQLFGSDANDDKDEEFDCVI